MYHPDQDHQVNIIYLNINLQERSVQRLVMKTSNVILWVSCFYLEYISYDIKDLRKKYCEIGHY